MKACLMILNPRRIPEALAAFDELDVAKCWLTSYSERQLEKAFPDAVSGSDFTHYVAVSDDVVVAPAALDAVLKQARRTVGDGVVTGFCNLDEADHAGTVNLTHQPLGAKTPSVGAYSFRTLDEMRHSRSPIIRSWFAGMTLTCMPRRLWESFPFGCYRGYQNRGYASDYHLSWRLQQAHVPILAPVKGECHHLKATWNEPDPRWNLFEADRETRWET